MERGVTSWALTLDCRDTAVVAAFWQEALGYVPAPPPEGFATWEEWFDRFEVPADERDGVSALVDPEGRLPALSLLVVPEPKTAKNRLHLDLRVSGGRHRPAAERAEVIEGWVARLEAAGGTVQQRHHIGGDLDHVVLLDPEGNELCVV